MNKLSRELKKELEEILDEDRFFTDPETLCVYECDGLTHFKRRPLAVAQPESTEEVVAIVKACAREKIPFTPRGAGTGLSGGALPPEDGGVLIDTSRMRRIIEINADDRYAVIEPGVINAKLSEAVAPFGLFYAPDPSSQMACTIGGNIAENSGGPHCLKYGATTNHVLGLTVVLADGQVLEVGGPTGRGKFYDLVGAFIGSEGTLGVVTRATVRLTRKPACVTTLLGAFKTLTDACRAVSALIAAGINASAIEALDDRTIAAVEASVFAAGYPKDAGAVLLVELDGHPMDVAYDREVVETVFLKFGAISIDSADDPERRAKLWKGRKGAFGAMGRVAPDLYVMDVVVPRSKLEEAIRRINTICDERKLRLANVFHAGEGNLHPNISYDGRDHDEVARVLDAGKHIVMACLDLGGALSGEHGIGVEKQEYMDLVFGGADLATFKGFRDVWNEKNLLNPGKLLPTPRACTEVKGKAALPPKASEARK